MVLHNFIVLLGDQSAMHVAIDLHIARMRELDLLYKCIVGCLLLHQALIILSTCR